MKRNQLIRSLFFVLVVYAGSSVPANSLIINIQNVGNTHIS